MSMHTDKAARKLRAAGAYSAANKDRWDRLMKFTKGELAEIACHLAGIVAGDSYDDAMTSDDAFNRLLEEAATLRDNGII